MKTQLHFTKVCFLGMLVVSPVISQISQDHADLCGDRVGRSSVPDEVSIARGPLNGITALRVGSYQNVELHGVNSEIRAVCSVSGSRLVAFGWNFVGYEINIIDRVRGLVADSFSAYDPTMSPSRRWLASRHFYPPQSEIQISEEYLLYDLGANSSANRHVRTQETTDAAGWAMYPMYPGNMPIDLLDVPDAETHHWRSTSFFWASDSQSVVFADSVGERLSIVVVLIKNNKPQPYTHTVLPAEVCNDSGPTQPYLVLKDASINSTAPDSSIRATFEDNSGRAACQIRQLNLRLRDFQPATAESYGHRTLKRSTPKNVN